MKKPFKWLTNIIATLIGAYALAGLYDHLPMNMPDVMDDGIRAVLRITGNGQLANPDDMATLSLMIVLVLSLVLAATTVALVNYWIKRRAIKRAAS